MLKNVRIATKVFGGFGVVLLLLVAISLTGTINLSDGNDNFTRYRKIALQTNQAGQVQANLLETRVATLKYLNNPSDKFAAAVKTYAEKTQEFNNELDGLVKSDVKKNTIKTAGTSISEYTEAFNKVTTLQAEGHSHVVNTLELAGPQMEQKLSKIMESAYNDQDAAAAYRAGLVLRDLMHMRLATLKFVSQNDEAAYKGAMEQSAIMANNYQSMLAELQNPTRRQLAEEINALHKSYESAIKNAHSAFTERNSIVEEKLNQIGPRVALQMEELKLGIKKEQDTLGPQASAAMERASFITLLVSGIAILFGIAAAWVIGMGIANPIKAITQAMIRLADGDKTIDIPGRDHKDEIGDMAGAVRVFKENMIKAEELAAREEEARQARDKRARQIEQLTKDFDTSVSQLLNTVAGASTQMESTASSMSGIASDTNHRAVTVASAAEQASTNVQAVASATEELSISIREISRQVSQSSDIAKRAVGQADQTDKQVQNLAQAAQKIGEIVDLISEIAEQTNLLALNATIEAARAGETGKGFAVVAAEVKELANQTAKATSEISTQIDNIQTETGHAVSAIQEIGATIEEISEITLSIASSVEEQSVATGDIAANVEQAATGTQEVSSNILEVTRSASETGAAAEQVTQVAGSLNEKAVELKTQVEDFLTRVRAA